MYPIYQEVVQAVADRATHRLSLPSMSVLIYKAESPLATYVPFLPTVRWNGYAGRFMIQRQGMLFIGEGPLLRLSEEELLFGIALYLARKADPSPLRLILGSSIFVACFTAVVTFSRFLPFYWYGAGFEIGLFVGILVLTVIALLVARPSIRKADKEAIRIAAEIAGMQNGLRFFELGKPKRGLFVRRSGLSYLERLSREVAEERGVRF